MGYYYTPGEIDSTRKYTSTGCKQTGRLTFGDVCALGILSMFIRCEVIEQLEELSEKSRSKTKYFNHWSMAQVGSTEKKIMEVKNLAGEHSNTYLWDFDFFAMSVQLKNFKI